MVLLVAGALAQTPRPGPPAAQPERNAVPQAAPAAASGGSRVQPPPPSYFFPLNQTLVYGAEWRLFDAGIATLRMENAGGLNKVAATADASGVISVLYHVRDRFEAYFDPRTYCSSRITKHTEEGFRRIETSIAFDGARNKAVLSEKNLKSNQSKRQENDVPGCVMDVVSALYYAGSLPLEPGAAYLFPLNDGGPTNDVRVTVEGREQVKVPGGAFNTIRVRAEAASGLVRDRGKVWIWYAEDTRVPVQMRARLFWGVLTFRLQRIDR